MKQFFKALGLLLLLSSMGTIDSSNNSCSSSCNTSCNSSCNDRCSNRNDCCDFSCDRSCSSGCCDSRDRRSDCYSCNSDFGRGAHFRSQGANTARELVGWQWEINRPDLCENYGVTYFAFEYQRSFRSKSLARAVFGTDTLKFAGSAVADRTADELVADNFGLSRNYRGQVSFCPRIENYIFDLGFYYGLYDCCWNGTYIRLHAPIVHTRWNLCQCVQTTSAGGPFPPCYVDGSDDPDPDESIPAASSLQEALSGNFLFGDMQTPWCSGRFDFCRRKKTGLADIDVILGYNLYNTDCEHFGLYLQAVLPTGGVKKNRYVFDPVVGNGGHFELGLGVSAHSVLWSCGDSNLAVFVEGNVTHMFRRRQCRLFDFCCGGPYSRYNLLKDFGCSGGNYNGNLVSATCVNNREVDVKINVKGDASVKLAYHSCNWGFDLGYNVYGHTRERIKLRCDDCCNFPNRYGVKGTEGVCCSSYPIVIRSGTLNPTPIIVPSGTLAGGIGGVEALPGCPTLETGSPILATTLPDNNTQPCASAFVAKPPVPGRVVPNSGNQLGDCSACLSYLSPEVTDPAGVPVVSLAENGFVVAGNNGPQYVNTGDLNVRSAEAPSVLTHKVFAHANYIWDCGCSPYLGIGGEAEFDDSHRRATPNGKCCRAGLNQWGVWVKGGFAF